MFYVTNTPCLLSPSQPSLLSHQFHRHHHTPSIAITTLFPFAQRSLFCPWRPYHWHPSSDPTHQMLTIWLCSCSLYYLTTECNRLVICNATLVAASASVCPSIHVQQFVCQHSSVISISKICLPVKLFWAIRIKEEEKNTVNIRVVTTESSQFLLLEKGFLSCVFWGLTSPLLPAQCSHTFEKDQLNFESYSINPVSVILLVWSPVSRVVRKKLLR